MGIYLDNAASTKVDPYILAKFTEIADSLYGNPSSKHTQGYLAENEIEFAKDKISEKIHCDNEDIFFTSGATMSNQLLIQGFIAKHPRGYVITTNVEHNDIMMLMDNSACYKSILRVKENGCVDVSELEAIIKYATCEMAVPVLVTIQMANSETGIIQPIQDICGVCRKYPNVYLHMDATQYIPYYPVNMECWGIDSISMSGQKIGGIKGSGLLVVRQALRDNIKSIIYGEQGLVGGTLSTPLIASLGVAFDNINYENVDDLKHKRDLLWSLLKDLGAILVGGIDNRLPNNIYCRFPGVQGLQLLYLLDEYDIYIGTGSACSTYSDQPSHVALAYGLTEEEAFECVRFTLSNETSYKDIEYVIKVLSSILKLI